MPDIFAGIDVGGTHVRIVLYDQGTRLCSHMKKLPFARLGHPEREVERNICSLLEAAFAERHLDLGDLAGIGLSLAAVFDRVSGDILLWPNNPVWNGFPLKAYLTNRYQTPVVMEDDANSAALGEQLAGAGKGQAFFAYMTVSTGIGCGLILNNRLYTGPNGWAGEIGHIRSSFPGDDEACNCGATGCFQAVASGPALLKQYRRATGHKGSIPEDLTLEGVAELAGQGEEAACSLFAKAGNRIAAMITALVMLLDLPLVIVGGGVAEAGDVLWKPVTEALALNLSPYKRTVCVVKSGLEDRNGALGALNLIYQTVNNRLLSV